jgi:hypothetical protein
MNKDQIDVNFDSHGIEVDQTIIDNIYESQLRILSNPKNIKVYYGAEVIDNAKFIPDERLIEISFSYTLGEHVDMPKLNIVGVIKACLDVSNFHIQQPLTRILIKDAIKIFIKGTELHMVSYDNIEVTKSGEISYIITITGRY